MRYIAVLLVYFMEEIKSSPHCAPTKSFKFKYVAEEELLRIVRKVRREKQKEKDAAMWKRYLEDKQKIHLAQLPKDEPKELPSSSLYEEACIPNVEHNLKASAQPEVALTSAPSEVDEPHVPPKRLLPIGNTLLTESKDGGMTARESGAIQRIALLRHRISLTLDSITGMVQCQPAEPDGPDDFERRKIRINEFLSRFSRNYLFQFQRQVAELRRHVVCASPETPGRHTEHQALMQKLVSAHQTAVQSLQAYLTQIPASLQGTNIFGKLKDLLYHLCDLSSLKNQLDVHAGMIKARENIDDSDEVFAKCKELLGLLEDRRTDLDDTALSARASSPLSAKGSFRPRGQHTHRSNSVMHHMSWKKSSACLARTKFGAPSSVRSSVRSHVSSSRENRSHEERAPPKSTQAFGCCNSELKEIIGHMHDVLCKKFATKNKRKNKHQCRSSDERNPSMKKKSGNSDKVTTEVQNLSKNVQLVITQHFDTESESGGYKDATTDTADLEGESKKPKKVVWATGETSVTKESINDKVSNVHISQSTIEESSENGRLSPRPQKVQDQRMFNYRKRFHEYNSKVQDPMIQRWCDHILDEVFQEISNELEPSFLLERMYQLEFKDPNT